MPVAIYTRLSEDRSGQQTATARQEADCRRYAKLHGLDVGRVYRDVDLSAYRRGVIRPEFEQLVSDVQAGAVQGVLCWKLDRLVRNHADFERLWEACDQAGALIASATEPIDSSTEIGMVVVRLLVSFARLESANISLRGRNANAALARRGQPHGSGQRAFGYERGYTAVIREEADAILDAASRVLDGESVSSVTRDWNRRGITTTTGRQWRPAILRRVLMAPHVAGFRVYHGEVVAKGTWEAILDEATHEKLKALLTDPVRSTGGGGPVRYALSGGVLRCGLCGSRMVSRPRGDKVRRYVCSTEPGRESCGKVGIVAEPLEAMVRDDISAALTPDRLAKARDATTGNDNRRQVLMSRLQADQMALDEAAVDRYDRRTITASQFAAVNRALQDRISETRRELSRLDTPLLATLPANVTRKWNSADNDWRRALVASTLDQIVIAPARPGLNRFDSSRVTYRWLL